MNEFNKINLGQEAQDYKVNPPASAWVRLDAKLKNDKVKNGKTKIFYFQPIFGFIAAASLAILLAVTIFLNNKGTDATTQPLAMAAVTQSDDISFTDDRNIYQISQLNTLKEAYKKLSTKQ